MGEEGASEEVVLGYPARARKERVNGLAPEHWAFLEGCVDYHETETHIFVHANLYSDQGLDDQLVLEQMVNGVNRSPGPDLVDRARVDPYDAQMVHGGQPFPGGWREVWDRFRNERSVL